MRSTELLDYCPTMATTEERKQDRTAISPRESKGRSGGPSWDDLLPHAKQRLRLRVDAWQAEPRVAQKYGDEFGIKEAASGVAFKSEELASPSVSTVTDSNEQAFGDKPSEAALAVAKSFQSEAEDPEAAPRSRTLFSGMRGAIASAIAHVILIFLLGFVTLKMPKPPAGMAFASTQTDAPEETVELTQPLEVKAPDSSEPTEPTTAPLDFANELQSVSSMQPATDALGELAPPSQAPSAAAMAATTAITSSSDASFFGAAAGGNSFCYVIDASGSMRGGPWEAARMELIKSLSSLKPKQKFYIIMFTRSLEAIPLPGEREPAARPLYATPENLEHARRWLMSVKVGGSGAPPKKAIELAIEKETDAIYLLTDGVTTVKDVAQVIRQQNHIYDIINGDQVRVPIHTIAFYSLDGQQLLRQIASENSGQFIYVPAPGGK